MNKTAFVISIVLTTIVLMSVGGVVFALRSPASAPEADNSAETIIQDEPAPASSLEQTLLEREAIYQQRIAEANARLEQAQAQLAAQSGLAVQPATSQAAVTTISAEQAAQIAADIFGRRVAWVEVVNVKGEDLYLVTLTSGELVYINMNGQVVGSAPAPFTTGSGSGGRILTNVKSSGSDSGGHESEHPDDDHENEHEDD